ncbi:archaellin/type IV pilin N-terminal domain-containing protein [Methanoculleus sp.]|uniref:archaellin/type IV pilin N-terminal domain-containing protein n=1 Tax=Methanoculleus sp. TaxID=90427 RepID=UPI002FCBC26C
MTDAGFTGLEAAIVLIAFVIVAAVFSFVVLQSGFSSAQQGQSVVHQGVQQAGSACTVTGMVYGVSNNGKQVKSIIIPVGLTAGSEPIDMASVSVRLVGPHHEELVAQATPLASSSPEYGFWSVQERVNSDADMLLEAGEQYRLNISPSILTDFGPYGSFAIEIKPAGRAALRVERAVPGSIDRVTLLK